MEWWILQTDLDDAQWVQASSVTLSRIPDLAEHYEVAVHQEQRGNLWQPGVPGERDFGNLAKERTRMCLKGSESFAPTQKIVCSIMEPACSTFHTTGPGQVLTLCFWQTAMAKINRNIK